MECTWGLDAILTREKNICGRTGKTLMKPVIYNNVLLMFIFLVLAKVPCLCKMLAFVEAGGRVVWNSLCSLCFKLKVTKKPSII